MQTLKNMGRKGLEYGSNALYVGCAFGPTLSVVGLNLALDKKETFASLPNTSRRVKRFAREHIKSVGVKPEYITIKHAQDPIKGYAANPTHNFVFVDSAATETPLDQLLRHREREYVSKRWAKRIKKELPQHEFAIEHEANHIKNNDVKKRLLAAVAIPVATYCMFKRLNPFKNNANLAYHLLKIPGGMCVGTVNMALLFKLARQQEYWADDGVSDDISVLKGGKRFLKKNYKKRKHAGMLTRQKMKDYGFSPLSTKTIFTIGDVFATHPSEKKRIARFNKRIALLAQKEKDAQYQKELEQITSQIQQGADAKEMDISAPFDESSYTQFFDEDTLKESQQLIQQLEQMEEKEGGLS